MGHAKVGVTLAGGHAYRHPCLKEGKSRLRWYAGGRLVKEDYGRGESSYLIREQDKGKMIRFEVTPVSRGSQALTGTPLSYEIGPVTGTQRQTSRPQSQPAHHSAARDDSAESVDSNDRGLP